MNLLVGRASTRVSKTVSDMTYPTTGVDMSAQLSESPDRRTGFRSEVGRETTLRLDAMPIDARMDNLSRLGFGLFMDLPPASGTALRVGLPGVGSREATIVWVEGNHAGCMFNLPLSPNDLSCAFQADVVSAPRIEVWRNTAIPMVPGVSSARGGRKFSYRMRLAILVGLTTTLWGLIIGGFALL
jgi:hypothetical protein